MSELLRAEHISYSFGKHEVLRDVSFSVSESEFVALVGPNGSGKSTLLRCLLGLLQPMTGRALLFGSDAHVLPERWRVGYVPQRPTIQADVPVTVREVVETGRLARRGIWRRFDRSDRDSITTALEDVGLQGFEDAIVRELSGGQQQRVFIARALAGEPELLILDEPVAGVDVASQHDFRNALVHMVHEHQTAILLVSHELGAVAEDLDRIVLLQQGIIAFDGSPSQLIGQGVNLGIHHEDLPVWLEGEQTS